MNNPSVVRHRLHHAADLLVSLVSTRKILPCRIPPHEHGIRPRAAIGGTFINGPLDRGSGAEPGSLRAQARSRSDGHSPPPPGPAQGSERRIRARRSSNPQARGLMPPDSTLSDFLRKIAHRSRIVVLFAQKIIQGVFPGFEACGRGEQRRKRLFSSEFEHLASKRRAQQLFAQ
ncbi:hypothetical protein ACWDOP_00905 [Nocardia sp. NPDC003693]